MGFKNKGNEKRKGHVTVQKLKIYGNKTQVGKKYME